MDAIDKTSGSCRDGVVAKFDCWKAKAQKALRFGLSDRIEIFTAWLMIFTGMLAIETAANVWVLLKTDFTLRGTLVAGNRAWITPNVDLVRDSIGAKKPVEMRITYINYGGEPANRVSVLNTPVQFLPVNFRADWQSKGGALDGSDCKSRAAPSYRIVPHQDEFTVTVSGDGYLSEQDVTDFRDGVKTFYVSGCVRYNTLGEEVATHYCRYFEYSEGRTIGFLDGDKKIFATDHCPFGNRAE
jgi:hypothetical protein